MQHHGVPTRLLDWTESPYVALYFSFDREPSGETSALWALDLGWLRTRAELTLGLYGVTWEAREPLAKVEHANRLLTLRESPLIVRIDPAMASERLVAQRGLLLCKLFAEPSFSHLVMSIMTQPELPLCPVVRKLEIDTNLRIEVLERLQEMDITSTSLFPGLDGFARWLRVRLQTKVRRESLSASAKSTGTQVTAGRA